MVLELELEEKDGVDPRTFIAPNAVILCPDAQEHPCASSRKLGVPSDNAGVRSVFRASVISMETAS